MNINNITVGNDCYPNNERIYKSLDGIINGEDIIFDFKYMTDLDISCLMFYSHYADDKFPNSNKILNMLYVPYSRMDREIKGYIFSLKYFCQMINSLNFTRVNIIDPHSNMTSGLLERCVELSIQPNIDKIFENEKIDYVFYPDNGALKRYSEIIKLPKECEVFYGNKKRNLNTGKIESFDLVNAPDLKDKNVLIIDDLCAFGGTFISSAELIKEQGVKNVYLYVTHCENSIYKGYILQSTHTEIDKVYTTDSLLDSFDHKKIIKL